MNAGRVWKTLLILTVILAIPFVFMPVETVSAADNFPSFKFPWPNGYPIKFKSGPHYQGQICGPNSNLGILGGLDFASTEINNQNFPVLAAAGGLVKSIGWDSLGGNTVKVDHGNGWVTWYSHLNDYAEGLTSNQAILQGTLLGHAGNTGVSYGIHLHLGLEKDGNFITWDDRTIDGWRVHVVTDTSGFFREYMGTMTKEGVNFYSQQGIYPGQSECNDITMTVWITDSTENTVIPDSDLKVNNITYTTRLLPSTNHEPSPGVYLCEHEYLKGRCHQFTSTHLKFSELGDFCNDCASSIKIVGDYSAIVWEHYYAGGKAPHWGGKYQYFSGNGAYGEDFATQSSAKNHIPNDSASSIFVWETNDPSIPPINLNSDRSPKEGVYMCVNGMFNSSSINTNPVSCFNFPSPMGQCTQYDIWYWNQYFGGDNGVTSFWLYGNTSLWIRSAQDHSKTETFTVNDAALYDGSPGGNYFDDDIGTFTVTINPITSGIMKHVFHLASLVPGNLFSLNQQQTCTAALPPSEPPITLPMQNADLVIANNPALAGSENSFTFSLYNPTGSTLYISEIWVEGQVPGGGLWKGWATPSNVSSGASKSFTATAPMWGDKPGTWTITDIVYKRDDGNFFGVPSNGYLQSQSFTMIYPDGTWMHNTQTGEDYLISNGKKHKIPDSDTRYAMGLDLATCNKDFTTKQLSYVASGNAIPHFTNGQLFRNTTNGGIYVFARGVYSFPNKTTLTKLGFTTWKELSNELAISMSKSCRRHYIADLTNAKFIKGSTQGIYYLDNGKRIIPTYNEFLCLGGCSNCWTTLKDDLIAVVPSKDHIHCK